VRTVRVQALEAGWSGSVYVLDSAPQSAPTGPSDAAGQNLPRDAAITLPTAKPGRFVLVWITRLPPDGPPFRLEIAEVGLAS
jgi:hypothetical protein